MASLQTVVRMTVGGETLDEARRVLRSLDARSHGPIEITEVYRSDAVTKVYRTLDGDVREAIAEQLASLTALPYEIEVMETRTGSG
ncbi:hypothetical protein [Streptomyces sp. NPDC004435]|uniref:hypothetical protein n=1 Tax=Streptomyces sp. NPDC004435 TaxID=3364701 RepID=UPI0036A5AD31